jgi:2-polyprenyl-6-methoxyphenol hydroxylase-like FAD-dependent oxidoreductase
MQPHDAGPAAPGGAAPAPERPRGVPQAAASTDAATERTQCCIAGGGPAGVMLALLLARQGVRVTLLEQHHDFDRDFRGDTLHPSVLEILDQLGLVQRVLALPHGELRQAVLGVGGQTLLAADFSHLPTRFPYIAMVPQARFLPLVVEEARRYPTFTLHMGAAVRELIVEDGVVHGVRYQVDGQARELRATLTVGADGRFSVVRRLAGFTPIQTAQAIDVLWFRVPRDPAGGWQPLGRIDRGHILVALPRADSWQLAWLIPKGGYQRLHEAGLAELRAQVSALEPELHDALEAHLTDWHQVSLLSVESSHVRRWYRPGLLLIGDAAHVMSPVGGVGINYAVQDAVVAANVLAEPLRRGHVPTSALMRVHLERALPTLVIQTIQNFLQRRILTAASQNQFALPAWLLRTPILRELPARLIGYGLWRVHPRE